MRRPAPLDPGSERENRSGKPVFRHHGRVAWGDTIPVALFVLDLLIGAVASTTLTLGRISGRTPRSGQTAYSWVGTRPLGIAPDCCRKRTCGDSHSPTITHMSLYGDDLS